MMNEKNYYLGIDVGHTKIKAGVFDSRGKLIFLSSQETPFVSDIIDTNELWICICKCIRKLLDASKIQVDKIQAVACSGHGNGMYAIDSNGIPLPVAYGATTEIGERTLSEWKKEGKDKIIRSSILQEMWTGQPLPILADLKLYDRTIYQAIDKVLLCKDFVNYCLTGEISTDYTDASAAGLLNNVSGFYDEKVYEVLGLQEVMEKLPPLKQSTDVVGYVTAKAAEESGLAEGTIVATGMFDVAASLIGAGIFEEGICGMISGTWGINALVSDTMAKEQQFLQCTRFIDGKQYLFIESAPTSSVNLEWLLKQVFRDIVYEEANQIVSEFAPEDVQVIYRPYLHGDLRGVHTTGGFTCLTAKDTRETMIRAVYEGVAFGHRKQIERLLTSEKKFDKIIFTGGAANSSVWCQIFADVLGCDIHVPKMSNSGILGATMIASVAAGEYENYETACQMMLGEYEVYHPDKEAMKIYTQKYERFCEK